MGFDEMQQAVNQAKGTLSLADKFVAQMANMIAGRLRKGGVWGSTLCALKRELADYNMHTGKWKEPS